MATMTVEKWIEEIKGMSGLDLSNLVKALEEEFGVSAAAAPAAVKLERFAGPTVVVPLSHNIMLNSGSTLKREFFVITDPAGPAQIQGEAGVAVIYQQDSRSSRGEYQYTSETFFNPSNIPIMSQPAYSLTNASLGYNSPGGHWQAVLWGKNLADKQYVLNVAVGGQAYSPHVTAPIGAPRTFGLRLNYTY